jgi:hypothetical protein
MSEAFDTVEVQTEAGEYVIELHPDYDSNNPLEEFDHEGIAVRIYEFNSWRYSDLYNDFDKIGRAGHVVDHLIDQFQNDDDVERRYKKWRAISGDPHILVTGSTSIGGRDGANYAVLVDTTSDYTDPEGAARATMAEYSAWADGEVAGYVVRGPDGETVDSCWGFYPDNDSSMSNEYSYMLEQARDYIAYDVEQRVTAANAVGAGFVGVL